MLEEMTEMLGQTDIYLVDQIMKGRYKVGDVLLDAGCGSGRNLHWFLRQGFQIYAVDVSADSIELLADENTTLPPDRFRVNAVESLSFPSLFFDSIISSAVLHFARNKDHFFSMLEEMYRVLKPEGSLFIRMASDIGIENRVQLVGEGIYLLPDGSTRFLITRHLLAEILERYSFSFLEPFKIVNVNDLRCMSTLVLQKQG